MTLKKSSRSIPVSLHTPISRSPSPTSPKQSAALVAVLLGLGVWISSAEAAQNPCPRPQPSYQCPKKSGADGQNTAISMRYDNSKTYAYLSDALGQRGINLLVADGTSPLLAGLARNIPDDLSAVRDISGFTATSGFRPMLYEASLKAATRNSHLYGVPIGIRMQGLIYFNSVISQKAGVYPDQWRTFEDVIVDLDKAKAIGVIPLVVEDGSWGIGDLFRAILSSMSGATIVESLYGDGGGINSPDEIERALRVLRTLSGYVDDGASGRPYHVSADLVQTGKALLQIGDSRSTELFELYQYSEVNCLALPGAAATMAEVELLSFPSNLDQSVRDAQDYVMSIADHADFQHGLAVRTGYFPAVSDAEIPAANSDHQGLNGCNEALASKLAQPAAVGVIVGSEELRTAIDDSLYGFWHDNSISPTDQVSRLGSILQAVSR